MIATVTAGQINTISTPLKISIHPLTNRAYVSNTLSNDISVIDGITNTVIATITLPLSAQSTSLGINPITNRLYSVNTGLSNVSVIDTTTNTIIATIPVAPFGGGTDKGIYVDSTLNRIYISFPPNFVAVIDGTTDVRLKSRHRLL
ncbi:YncE family protein [Bacillus cereus]